MRAFNGDMPAIPEPRQWYDPGKNEGWPWKKVPILSRGIFYQIKG